MTSISSPPEPQQLDARILKITHLTAEIVRLVLQPIGNVFHYQAGQFASLRLPSGITRSYSMVRRPGIGNPLEFHIRLRPGGAFSQWLRHILQNPAEIEKALLKISGPYGDCTAPESSDDLKNILFLATGTGVAPIIGLIEEFVERGIKNPLILYWSGSNESDFYFLEYFKTLKSNNKNFQFFTTTANQPANRVHRTGFIQDLILEDYRDLRSSLVFACGSPAMISNAKENLTSKLNLPAENFRSDVFESNPQSQSLAGDPHKVSVKIQLIDGSSIVKKFNSGISLMSALQQEGLISGVCGGNKACGTCRIVINDPPPELVTLPDRAEQRLLSTLPNPLPGDRLACQIPLVKNLEGLFISITSRPL